MQGEEAVNVINNAMVRVAWETWALSGAGKGAGEAKRTENGA